MGIFFSHIFISSQTAFGEMGNVNSLVFVVTIKIYFIENARWWAGKFYMGTSCKNYQKFYFFASKIASDVLEFRKEKTIHFLFLNNLFEQMMQWVDYSLMYVSIAFSKFSLDSFLKCLVFSSYFKYVFMKNFR